VKLVEPPTLQPVVIKALHAMNILVVEDDNVNQMVMTRMLKEKGYTVDVANNGKEALELHDKKEYDLILMDIQMPGIDGLETTKRIREREGEEKYTKIVALTAYALHGDRERFLNLGMDEYLPKPIRMEELFRMIEKVCSAAKSDFDISNLRVDNDGNIVPMQNQAIDISVRQDLLILEIDQIVKDLVRSLDNSTFECVENLAHDIKNLCNQIGADELKSLAFQIELAVRRNNVHDVTKCFAIFEHEYKTFKNIYFNERKHI
jgi:CheY-like chemotaxis protein